MRDTYMVEYVAQAFRHKPNIRSLTPDKKIQSNVKKLQLLLLMFCNIMTDPTRQNKIVEIKNGMYMLLRTMEVWDANGFDKKKEKKC